MHDSFSALRLIVDAPAAGAWNMAVDEVLLGAAAERSRASLRFYRWSEPTLSLGYFQRFRQRQGHPPSHGCAVVRRQTGGGAIVHDQELTYCLAVPLAHPLAADAMRLYLAVHEALSAALAPFDIATTLATAPHEAPGGPAPFLCFQRRTRGDVLLGSSKVCGSAQRRRRGAILQHGSLLLAASRCAPELRGIRELSGKRFQEQPLIESWGREIGKRVRLVPQAARLEEAELAEARTWALEKYGTSAWNERR